MGRVKKCLCFLIAISLLCSVLSACGGGEAKRTGDGQLRLDSASEETAAESYVSSRLELQEEGLSIDNIAPYKEGFLLSGYNYRLKKPSICHCSSDGSEVSAFDVSRLDAEQSIVGLAASEDGIVYILISTYKNKEFVAYSLYKFSESGEAKLVSDLPFDKDISARNMLMANGELYINCTEYPAQTRFLAICSLQGEIIVKKEVDDFFDFASDGRNVFLSVRSPEGNTLYGYDREKNVLSKLEKFNEGRLLCVNENIVYLGDATSVLSYDLSSGSLNRVFEWIDAGMNANVGTLIVMSSGEIVLRSLEGIVLLKKTTESQDKKQDITMAINGMPVEFAGIVTSFNESSSEYRVKLVDYSSHQDPGMKLATEFVSSNAPDIVDISAFSGISGEKNFENLTEYFDNDPDISQEDLLPAPLDAMKNDDGKLFGIAPAFTIWSFFTTKQNMLENDFSSVTERLREMGSPDEAFENLPRDYFLAFAFGCGGADSYSEEDIAMILEYAKEIPTEPIYIEGAPKRKYIVENSYDPSGLFLFSHTFFGENPEDMVLFGMPFRMEKSVIKPSYLMGIPKTAGNKAGAWEFIKFLLLSQPETCLTSSFCPVLKDAYENKVELLREAIDNGTAGINGITITGYFCIDAFDALLNEPCVIYDANSKVFEIVMTNAEPYFTGHVTAQKAAADIVNTLKIYYSEQG